MKRTEPAGAKSDFSSLRLLVRPHLRISNIQFLRFCLPLATSHLPLPSGEFRVSILGSFQFPYAKCRILVLCSVSQENIPSAP